MDNFQRAEKLKIFFTIDGKSKGKQVRPVQKPKKAFNWKECGEYLCVFVMFVNTIKMLLPCFASNHKNCTIIHLFFQRLRPVGPKRRTLISRKTTKQLTIKMTMGMPKMTIILVTEGKLKIMIVRV